MHKSSHTVITTPLVIQVSHFQHGDGRTSLKKAFEGQREGSIAQELSRFGKWEASLEKKKKAEAWICCSIPCATLLVALS